STCSIPGTHPISIVIRRSKDITGRSIIVGLGTGLIPEGRSTRATNSSVRSPVSDRSRRNIERKRSCIRDVEALDLSWKIESREMIAGRARELAEALAFGAEHKHQRLAN